MKKITDILSKKDFTISVEIVPPKNGIGHEGIYNHIEKIKEIVDFVSVTKGAGGSLRGGTLPISYFIQQKFNINTIAHFVCRERTAQEIENDMIDLHYFNIKNILALRGDPPAGSREPWNGEYKYAYRLVEQIKQLNEGKYLPRNNDPNPTGLKTDFCIIVAGHPEDPIEEELEHIKKKVESGAQAIITQMVFSFDEYKNYVEALRKNNIILPVIPGIRPLKTMKQIESAEKFFGVKVAHALKDGINQQDFAISYFKEMIKNLKDYGAPGVHLFVLNDIEVVSELIQPG